MLSNKISYRKIEMFRQIFLKINAVFNLLYQKAERAKPLQIEIVLAEAMIRDALESDLRKYKYFDMYVLKTAPLLTVEEKDDSETLEITLSNKWLSLGKGLLTEELSHYKTVAANQEAELKQSYEKITELTEERDGVIRERDEVIIERDAAIEDVGLKDRELAQKTAELITTQGQLSNVTKKYNELRTQSVRGAGQHRFMRPATENNGDTANPARATNSNI